MKKLFTFVAAIASLLIPQAAQAWPLYGYYVGVQSGPNWEVIQPQKHRKFDMVTGFSVAGVAGYRFRCGPIFEVEFNYRRNYFHWHKGEHFGIFNSSSSSSSSFNNSSYDSSGFELPSSSSSSSSSMRPDEYHGHSRSMTWMGNIYWEFDMPGVSYDVERYPDFGYGKCGFGRSKVNDCFIYHLKPYLGGGIGFTRIRTQLWHQHVRAKGFTDGFAWQAMTGLNYEYVWCSQFVIFNLEYKFHHGRDKFHDHTVALGARFYFKD